MSCGALKFNDKYIILPPKGEKRFEGTNQDNFRNTQYITTDPAAIKNFGIPESAIPRLNSAIGELLIAILNISFTNRRALKILNTAPPEDKIGTLAPCSTLSAKTIESAIQQNIGKLIRNVLGLANDESATQTQKPFVKNEALVFSDNIPRRGELIETDFLPKPARDLIDKYGPGCATAINDLLKDLAENISIRAYKPFESLRDEMATLAEIPATRTIEDTPIPNPAAEAPYSTLNPFDLIDTIMETLEDFWKKLAKKLPQPLQEQTLALLHQPTAKPTSTYDI